VPTPRQRDDGQVERDELAAAMYTAGS
jgi:hypothetical protein